MASQPKQSPSQQQSQVNQDQSRNPDESSPDQPQFSDPDKEILTPSGDQTQATEE
jgi:hypothetical protein